MKRTQLAVVFWGMFIFITLQTTALAQRPMRMSPDERTSQLKNELGLSDEQAAKVKSILEIQQQEMQKLFEAAGEDREARREAMMNQGKETDEKIAALLTDEQKVKFNEMQLQRRNRFGQGRKPRD